MAKPVDSAGSMSNPVSKTAYYCTGVEAGANEHNPSTRVGRQALPQNLVD